MITNITVCVSKELLCDENINCGAAGSNDEDVRICDGLLQLVCFYILLICYF